MHTRLYELPLKNLKLNKVSDQIPDGFLFSLGSLSAHATTICYRKKSVMRFVDNRDTTALIVNRLGETGRRLVRMIAGFCYWVGL